MSGGSGPAPPTTANLGNGITLSVPAGGGASGTSPYGLTDGWGSAGINIDGFPVQVASDLKAALQRNGVDITQPTVPGDAVAKALATLPRGDVAQVQQMLLYGGFYPSTVKSAADLQLGSFQPQDLTALKGVVQSAGQTGQPLGSYLTGAANYGQAQGTINQVAGVGVKPIPIPADLDVDAVLKASAEKLLGRDPNASDLAEFRGMYDQMLVTASKQAQALANQSTAQGLGDPAALGAAAGRLGEPGYFGNAQSAPPTPAPPPSIGLPSTQGPLSSRDQELTAQQNAADYYNQHTTDENTVSAFNQQAGSNLANATPTLHSAPNINNAADQFLQDRYGQEIAQQGAVGAYNELLSVMGK